MISVPNERSLAANYTMLSGEMPIVSVVAPGDTVLFWENILPADKWKKGGKYVFTVKKACSPGFRR